MKNAILYIIFILTPLISFNQGFKEFSPPERYFLELVTSDTVSETVSYLPTGYRFNIDYKGRGQLIFVKNRNKNYFLLEGTNRVYITEKTGSGIYLKRIDSTFYFGDNYGMMAFCRKDTLYQYGGYGFWKVRDFFIQYRPNLREWEIVSGGDGMENLYTYNYYHPALDKFYTIGQLTVDSHKDLRIFRDSVYSYDFGSKKFTTLGLFTAFNRKINIQIPPGFLWYSPFGMGFLWGKKLNLVDFPNNRMYEAFGPVNDAVLLSYEQTDPYNRQFNNQIYLKDSLFFINGDKDRLLVSKIRLRHEDFDLKGGQKIYEPRATNVKREYFFSVSPFQGMILAVVLLLLSFIPFLVWKYFQKRPATLWVTDVNGGNGKGHPVEKLIPLATEADPALPDIDNFLRSLTPVEKELLKEMARHSLQNRHMDTDAINKILGVSHKDPEVQKGRRSMAITHINNTYSQTMKINGLLIQRERDNDDKRAYLYFIPDDRARLLAGVLA